MNRPAYVPSYVPAYCENMTMTPPAYYHQLNIREENPYWKVHGLIRTTNPSFGVIEDADYSKQLVWVCDTCYESSDTLGTLGQLFNPTWEPKE